MAHPDDEIIFGWPVLQDKKIKKKILICSSDFHNPDRAWCKYRKEALFEVAKYTDSEVECLDYPSEFYRFPTRPDSPTQEDDGERSGPYRRMCQTISNKVLDMEAGCDAVFTHNPYGEYGHIDHLVVFDTVLKTTNKPILITDIVQSSNWARKPVNKKIKKMYYSKMYKKDCSLDQNLLKFCKLEYEKKNAWTWSKQVAAKCNLFLL